MPRFNVFAKEEYKKARCVPRNLLSPGSREYAISTLGHLEDVLKGVRSSEDLWRAEIAKAQKDKIHELLGLSSLDALLNEELGVTTEEGAAEVATRQQAGMKAAKENKEPLRDKPGNPTGANQHTERKPDKDGNGKDSSPYGNDASYRVKKLRRDHPEAAERLERGEFKSVAAAERWAKGEEPHPKRKTPSALEQVKKLLPKLTDAEADDLARLLAHRKRGRPKKED